MPEGKAIGMAASRDDWKRVPFDGGLPIPYRATFSAAELERIRDGLVPEAMEDKWFVYCEEPHLYFHQSWTGQPVYRVRLERSGDGAEVAEALCVAGPIADSGAEHQARLLDFLVSNLLLGMAKPFPLAAHARTRDAALWQHVFSGTGYPYVRSPTQPVRRHWWQIWR